MTRHHDVHVSADRDLHRWRVTRGGRVMSRHRTQPTAVRTARREARRRRVDLITHGRDGRIRSKDSYGDERTTGDSEH